MKVAVFSIFDKKSGLFSMPFFLTNANLALRSFGDAVLDSTTGISKHPEDYQLFQLSEFDDNSGRFTCDADTRPQFLAHAVDFLPPETPITPTKITK